MGIFWDLMQQGQIRDQADRSRTLEQRVMQLEQDLLQTRQLMLKVIERLETHLGTDLNQDGRVGR